MNSIDLHTRIRAYRRTLWQRNAADPIMDEDEAAAYIDRLGFVTLTPALRMGLPSLYEAAPSNKAGFLWKDTLPAQRRAFYGRVFPNRTGLVALDVLPALIAVSPLAEFGGDRFTLFQQGKLGRDANRMAGVLNAKGPLSTRELRRESVMMRAEDRARFIRALWEVQARFLGVRAAISGRTFGGYSFVWDGFHKVWPQALDTGLRLRYEEALAGLIVRYITTTGGASPAMLGRVFDVEQAHSIELADWLADNGDLLREEVEGRVYYLAPGLFEE